MKTHTRLFSLALVLVGETSARNPAYGFRYGVTRPAQQTTSKWKSYTAMGDSWAAGWGPTQLYNGSSSANSTNSTGDGCQQREGGYPVQLYDNYLSPSTSFQYLACGGANTTEIRDQMDGQDFAHPDLVTVDAGGNDGRFAANMVMYCVVGQMTQSAAEYQKACEEWLQRSSSLDSLIGPNISALIQEAKTQNLNQNQNRTVVVTGYAQPYNATGNPEDCPQGLPNPPLGPQDLADQMNKAVLSLNAVIAAEAYAQGVIFADVDPAFDGHRLCDPGEPWLQTNVNDSDVAIGHPTVEGYGAMANKVARVLGIDGASSETGATLGGSSGGSEYGSSSGSNTAVPSGTVGATLPQGTVSPSGTVGASGPGGTVSPSGTVAPGGGGTWTPTGIATPSGTSFVNAAVSAVDSPSLGVGLFAALFGVWAAT